MRKDIAFESKVSAALYDEGTNTWTVTTAQGQSYTCTYLVSASGLLSVAYEPPFKGVETFKGQWFMSARWPDREVDFQDKRVAIVGSGSTAVQILPVVAQSAKHVTLFQRTPNYVLPGRNHPLDDAERQAIKRNYASIWDRIRNHVFAMPIASPNRLFDSVSPEQRQRIFEAGWETGGFRYIFETFDDLLVNEKANEAAAEFIRNKIRAIVKDPETAELLCPKYPLLAKRPPLGNFYYEAFNRENVSLVDVSHAPIEEITPAGLRTADRDFEFDIIIFALGFDAGTGALTHLDMRGKNGLTMKQRWAEGPRTYLGITVDGFPNMFMISGPQTPFANIPPIIEGTVEWIGQAMRNLQAGGHNRIEAKAEFVDAWDDRVQMFLDATLLGKGEQVSSWFLGANIPGKPHSVLFYFGGAGTFLDDLKETFAGGFRGFEISHQGARQPEKLAS
jgi:cyclohexanone monooxygenase